MKRVLGLRRYHYVAAISIFLIFSITTALATGMTGCTAIPVQPEEIDDWYGLNATRDNPEGSYVLIEDLDETKDGYYELVRNTPDGMGWEPIGTDGMNAFKGTFDGKGHIISDLFIERPGEDNVGLFGYVLGGVINNVTLMDVDVTGKENVGGVVGHNRGTLGYSSSAGIVKGTRFVGGLTGYTWDGTVHHSESWATVFSQSRDAGGLVGYNSLGAEILFCNYRGDLVQGETEVGGLAGLNNGRVAWSNQASTACVVTGAADIVGGLVGLNGGVVEQSLQFGSVCAKNKTGGLVGSNGLVGQVIDCHNKGNVDGNCSGADTIGLNWGTVSRALSADAPLGGFYVGGAVGWNEGTVSNSDSAGNVIGITQVGGLVGANWGNITTCSSSGEVTGDSDVGRLVGYNKGTVSNSQSTSCVTDALDCGPLVGRDEGTVISDSVIPLKNPGIFVQMIPGYIDSLDPAWVYDNTSGEQVQYIYETLLFFDGEKTDQFVPVLATEWNSSPDGTAIRFKIREGVKFHEGGDVTPEDVEYSFERAMVQNRSGGPVWMLYESLIGTWGSDTVTFTDIDGAVQVDGDWVQFNLAEPGWGLAFLQILCSPWASIVDKEWCVANGDWDGTAVTWQDYSNPEKTDSYLYDHTNGTGPWKLNLWEAGVQIKLERFDGYWGGPAPFGYVITQWVDEWTTRRLALLNGDADLVYVPRTYIDELDGIAGLNVYQDLPALSIDVLSFNFNIASDSDYIGSGGLDGNGIPTDFFSDIDVRKGFCYAFGYETFIEDVLLGEGQRVGSPIIEGLPFYNSGASMYSFDLDKAEEHLRAAWGGQVWETGFEFSLLYNTGNTARETTCEILSENLAAINPKFNVIVQSMDWTSYLSAMVYGRLPMFQMSWIVDYPHPDNIVVPFMDRHGFFAELQSYGYPELDQLIEDAFGELHPVVQEDMYYEIQARYYEDAPGIILYQPLGRSHFTEHIHGFYFNPMIRGQAGPLYHMNKLS